MRHKNDGRGDSPLPFYCFLCYNYHTVIRKKRAEMKEYKIFTFEAIADRVGMCEDAHRRVRERMSAGATLAEAVRAE